MSIIIMFYFRQEPIILYIHTSKKKHTYTHMMNNRGTCSEKNIYIYKYTYMTCSKNIYEISQDKKYIYLYKSTNIMN